MHDEKDIYAKKKRYARATATSEGKGDSLYSVEPLRVESAFALSFPRFDFPMIDANDANRKKPELI